MMILKNRKGISLIVVMLIILGVTAIAIVSLRTTQNDLRQVNGFTYNRQAAQSAHSGAIYLHMILPDEAPYVRSKQNNDASNKVPKAEDEEKKQQAIANAINYVVWYHPDKIAPFSGMNTSLPTDTDQANRLKGDLARPTTIVGSIGNLTLIDEPVPGFSDSDLYCVYHVHSDSYALFGRAVPVQTDGTHRYYLLSDLNARVSGFKREMKLDKLPGIPCN